MTGCKDQEINPGRKIGDQVVAAKKILDFYDQEYRYSNNTREMVNRFDSCDYAALLRPYLDQDPVADALAALTENGVTYLALSQGAQPEIFSMAMPEEVKFQALKSGTYSVVEGVSDHVRCGEHFVLMMYMRWYTEAYNSIVYAGLD
jgi:hypothetical protein